MKRRNFTNLAVLAAAVVFCCSCGSEIADSSKMTLADYAKLPPKFHFVTFSKGIFPSKFFIKNTGDGWVSFAIFEDKYLKEIIPESRTPEYLIEPSAKSPDDLELRKLVWDALNAYRVVAPSWWPDWTQFNHLAVYRFTTRDGLHVEVVHDLKYKLLYCYKSQT